MNKELLVNGHELGTKSFEMEDGFGSDLNAVVEEGGYIEHRDFENRVDTTEKSEDEEPKDDRGRDAVGDQFIELPSDDQQLLSALILHDKLSNLINEEFPIRLHQWGVMGEWISPNLGGFKLQNGPA